jgi:CRP-like cAMP-binding protein
MPPPDKRVYSGVIVGLDPWAPTAGSSLTLVTRSHSIQARRRDFYLTIEFPYRDNLLLAALSDDDFSLLRPGLSLIELVPAASVFRSGEAAGHVWFPHRGMISIVAHDADGESVEVATVGREGMTGLSLVLGSATMTNEAMVQVAGQGSRIEATSFRTAIRASASLKDAMLRYVLAVITQISQNAACNQLHAINTRCARWLLTAHDRAGANSFALTHEYLAMMLGVTRPSVSAAASALKLAGLIRYSRGIMTILDRAGLEAAACDCYGIIEGEFSRLREAPQA